MDHNRQKHLPLFGVGPLYGAGVIGISILTAVILFHHGFSSLAVLCVPLKIIYGLTGILLIVCGGLVWGFAALGKGCIDKYILRNELCTQGVYGLVRNPCYSGIMLMCTGGLCLLCNRIVIPLFLLYWLSLTVLMKATEEKWLEKLYGQSYIDYCHQVNRCIPWPTKKTG